MRNVRVSLLVLVLLAIARFGQAQEPPHRTTGFHGFLFGDVVYVAREQATSDGFVVGQLVVVRSDAHPEREFNGKVASLAPSLGPGKLGQRGPRRPSDVDVLEVVVDMDGQPPLLPGMRVDVFFRPTETVDGAPKTN